MFVPSNQFGGNQNNLYVSGFNRVWDLATSAGDGNIEIIRKHIVTANPEELGPDGKSFMYWFICRVVTYYDNDDRQWQQRLPIVVDLLQSHGFRMKNLDDLGYAFSKGAKYHGLDFCVKQLEFLDFLEEIGLWLPPDVKSYREKIFLHVRRDLLKLADQNNLPQVPEEDVFKSELAYQHFKAVSGFDIHEQNLNILRGKGVSGNIPKVQLESLRRMESFFRENSPLSRTSVVFRGIRLSSIDDLNTDPDTVTFVSWKLEKALKYFFSPASYEDKGNSIPILLVIELNKGMPIIRTAYPDELVLPSGTFFELQGDPIYLRNIFCRMSNDDDRQWGAILRVRCIPIKRKRIINLY